MWPRANLRRWGRIRVEDLELYGERVLHVERQQFVRQPILVGKPSSEGTSSSGSAASENSGPTGARPDAPETIKVPSSEVLKSAKVVMAGGYKASKDSGYAKLYSVWKVDGTGPGEATIQYELLDSAARSSKPPGTRSTSARAPE
jgi:hypothetical protein